MVSRGCKGKLGRRVDDTDHGIWSWIPTFLSTTAVSKCGKCGCAPLPRRQEFSFLREFHILSVLQPRYARLTSTWKPCLEQGNWGDEYLRLPSPRYGAEVGQCTSVRLDIYRGPTGYLPLFMESGLSENILLHGPIGMVQLYWIGIRTDVGNLDPQ